MIVKYSNYQPHLTNQVIQDDCVICSDALNSGKVVAHHSNSGQLHPIHQKCLKVWLFRNPICPTCRAPVDLNSVFPISDGIKQGAVVSLIHTGRVLSSAMTIYLVICPIFDTEDDELAFAADFYLRGEAISLAITQFHELSKISECFSKSKDALISLTANLSGLIGVLSASYFGGLLETVPTFPFFYPKTRIVKLISSLVLVHLSTASIGAGLVGWINRPSPTSLRSSY